MTEKKSAAATQEQSSPSWFRGPFFWIFSGLFFLGFSGFLVALFLLVPLFTPARPPVPPGPAAAPVSPVPTPTPHAGDFDERMAVAAAMQQREDYAGALLAYTRLHRDFPENPKPQERMEMIAALLRFNGFSMTPEKFIGLRPALEDAASRGVVSAQMILGEQLRGIEPAESLQFFRDAARAGQTEAMTQAGLMLSNGRGINAPDLRLAVEWFERASAEGDADAMAALAECLLHGKGTKKNPQRAVDLLRRSAALHHPLALNLLGDLYATGIGVPQNFSEAYDLFSRSAAQGFGDGIANLGALTMRGEGTPADPAKAIAIWKEGVRLGSPSCMVNYAKALESGRGISRDRDLARHWYVLAAQGGNEEAIQWCRDQKVPY
ncbi:MAG: sel1 repeat family protein [Chthoniobacterales bacterium]|nr:sel1 repeat family protein [Chthoniobacterales bacterium]